MAAGAAGLGAANALKGSGLSVIVLEARDRLGGRAHTIMASPDVTAMINACRSFGARITAADTGYAITGFAGQPEVPNDVIKLESTSTMLFCSLVSECRSPCYNLHIQCSSYPCDAHTNLSIYYMQQGRIEDAELEKGEATAIQFEKLIEEKQAEKARAKQASQQHEDRERQVEMFHKVLEIDPVDQVANFGL